MNARAASALAVVHGALVLLALLVLCLSGCSATGVCWNPCTHSPRHVVDLTFTGALYALAWFFSGIAVVFVARWRGRR